ncbi:hypothetical protein EI94DRAFT_1725344 [Lactarius quietus]|nr:hypothetical protein EI94DRAFT_1725344 [Lactarius quietus]
MKFIVPFAVLVVTVSSRPISQRDVNENLIPQFGFQSGLNPTGSGDCDGAVNGANGQPIKIPCDCPPDRDSFVQKLNANVAAGHVTTNPTVLVGFPQDNSTSSQIARINTAIDTLQNLDGPGKGCPVVSTTFQKQIAAINAGDPPPPPVIPLSSSSPSSPAPVPTPKPAAAAPPPTPSTSGTPTPAQIEALAPPLGFTAGKNPTGTGNCDGAVNGADGKPIEVPCSCPPSQAVFNQNLVANVLAGQAVHNPSVKVTFPIDNSTSSQQARLTAASITLQNLNGPGQGCPIVSTTFQAQSKAISAGEPLPAPVIPSSSPSSSPAPVPSHTPSPSPSPKPTPAAGQPPAPSTPGTPTPAQIEALAPPLGFTAGKNPTGTGNCDGAVDGADGKPIEVPCSCPPSQDVFNQNLVANVLAGQAVHNPTVKVTFPIDNSTSSQQARLTAASITLQNLNGPGQGCPIVSTTFQAQSKAISAGEPLPPSVIPSSSPSSSPAPVPSPSPSPSPTPTPAAAPPPAPSTSGTPTPAQIEAVAPNLGFTAGKNPTGSGNCDGAVNGADGKPIEVPCSCPPDQQTFNQHLVQDVLAGHAVNNPSVKVSYPLDNSPQSQLARVDTALVTLQNLFGPGKGCPAVSTTLSAQQAALLKQQ